MTRKKKSSDLTELKSIVMSMLRCCRATNETNASVQLIVLRAQLLSWEHVRRTGRDQHVTGHFQMTQHKASLLLLQDAITKYQLFGPI